MTNHDDENQRVIRSHAKAGHFARLMQHDPSRAISWLQGTLAPGGLMEPGRSPPWSPEPANGNLTPTGTAWRMKE